MDFANILLLDVTCHIKCVVTKCVLCYLGQTLVKESHDGSEIVLVVWIQMVGAKTGRTNGRMKTGKKLSLNFIGNFMLTCMKF